MRDVCVAFEVANTDRCLSSKCSHANLVRFRRSVGAPPVTSDSRVTDVTSPPSPEKATWGRNRFWKIIFSQKVHLHTFNAFTWPIKYYVMDLSCRGEGGYPLFVDFVFGEKLVYKGVWGLWGEAGSPLWTKSAKCYLTGSFGEGVGCALVSFLWKYDF